MCYKNFRLAQSQGLLNGQVLDMSEDGKVLVSSFVTGIGIWDTRADTVTPFSSSPGFSPNSMNNNGQFIGQIIFGGTIPSNAAFWDSITSTFLNLNPSSTDRTVPNSINDSAQIVGSGQLPVPPGFVFDHATQAVIWENGIMNKLPTLGSEFHPSSANDINNLGQIVGSYGDRAVIWENGQIDALPMIPLFDGRAVATDINEHGLIVEISTNGHDGSHGTLWYGNRAIDLNDYLPSDLKDAGWVLTTAKDINDDGWIVGEIHKSNGSSHAILLSTTIPIPPIPEPSTYAMLLIGLGVPCFVVRRRKKRLTLIIVKSLGY